MKKLILTTITMLVCFTTVLSQSNASKDKEYLKYFQGTFASTPKNELWVKITISGRNVKIWTSMGVSGEWGNPQTCVLREWPDGTCVDTDRDYDGRKYFRITSSGCKDPVEVSINYSPSREYGKYTYQLGMGGNVLQKVKANYFPWN